MFRNGRLLSSLALSMSLFALAGPLPAGAQEAAVALPTTTATDAAAAGPAIPNEKCFGCHDDAEFEDSNGGSVAVLAAPFGASAHKRVACVECHTAAVGVKHKGKRQPLGPVSFDVCMECHEEDRKSVV